MVIVVVADEGSDGMMVVVCGIDRWRKRGLGGVSLEIEGCGRAIRDGAFLNWLFEKKQNKTISAG